jgi:hypothetical protein
VIKTATTESAGKLALVDALDALVSSTAADEQPVLCGILLDRFEQLQITALPSCSASITTPADRCHCDDPNATGCP